MKGMLPSLRSTPPNGDSTSLGLLNQRPPRSSTSPASLTERLLNHGCTYLGRSGKRCLLSALLLIVAIAGGCRPATFDATYGKRRGTPEEVSVNGTSVLGHLFENSGHRVITWRRLSPKLDQFQTIVWFPNDFAPPTKKQREFLEQWLARGEDRTLVYVGRDYDASIEYWRKVQPSAPPAQAFEVARRLALAQATHENKRAKLPDGESCDWFVTMREPATRSIESLEGAWAEGIDASKADLHLAGRMDQPPEEETQKWLTESFMDTIEYDRLLSMNGKLFAGRIRSNDWLDGQILFIANGSFLLNLPLVNVEHRKLAHRLIAECGAPGRTAFLESDEGGPPVFDNEPGENAPTGFEVFTVWPLGVILVHLTALGFLACFALFPIFGRPRELPQATTADFGQHVEALGELLEQAGDRGYAEQRINAYHEHVRRESVKQS